MAKECNVIKENGIRIPDLPKGVRYTVLEDNGNTMLVDVIGKTTEEQIKEVRKEAKQRTESVVSKIADIIERKDFKKQGIGKEIADEIRNSNAKK